MAELLEKELVFRIIGCAMAAHNTLGHGLREKTYENSLAVEFKYQGLEYSKQTSFPVYYRNELVDEFIPDLVVEKRVIVDTKTVESIVDEHHGTMLNYLKITGLKVGVIINDKHRKLEWERLVLDEAR